MYPYGDVIGWTNVTTLKFGPIYQIRISTLKLYKLYS